MIIDAHAHIDVDRPGILTVLCGTEPLSAERVLSMRAGNVIASCALHPWYAARHSVEDMLPYIEKSPILGEIGLDSVWTDVPMVHQYKAFREQLEIAARLNKPIVLHTKGMEEEIARMVRSFPHPVVVHWYSGPMDALEDFLAQGCHFTIGPDIAVNPSVQAVAKLAPDDRILFETDGMDAVRWALGDIPSVDLPRVLYSSMCAAAKLRNQDSQTLLEYANGNFLRLL